MKIYLAAVESPKHLRMIPNCLLSYYDIEITTVPFRKETFKTIKYGNKQKRIRTRP